MCGPLHGVVVFMQAPFFLSPVLLGVVGGMLWHGVVLPGKEGEEAVMGPRTEYNLPHSPGLLLSSLSHSPIADVYLGVLNGG